MQMLVRIPDGAFRSTLRYMLYWRSRFLEQPLTEFCSVIKTNSSGPVGASADPDVSPADTRVMTSSLAHENPAGRTRSCSLTVFVSSEKQENYFLLCDVLPEDRVLRERLQQKRLVRKLRQQSA